MATLTDKQEELLTLLQKGGKIYTRKRRINTRRVGGKPVSKISFFLDCQPGFRNDVRIIHWTTINGLILKGYVRYTSGQYLLVNPS